jgi:hypothetical protein
LAYVVERDCEIVAQGINDDDYGFGEGFWVPAATFWCAGAFEGRGERDWRDGAGGF